MHSNYLQMPPDSTGKKILVNPLWIIPVASAANFFEDDLITGGTSGTLMRVVQKNTVANYIYAKYVGELQDGGSFTVGENLLVNNVVISTVVAAQYSMYSNTTSLVSHDNPFHGQRVDAKGQAYVRYEEGAQIIDAVGRTKTSSDKICGAYKFTTLDNWDEFIQTQTTGTASKTMDANNFSLKLQTGTATNDEISLTSHKYHNHAVSTGLLVEMLLQVGDAGKINLSREWGYADSANGMFFDLMGTELSIVVRNSSTGSPIDTHYPQSAWNRDRLDGSLGNFNPSGLELDVTKVNRYWLDFNRGSRFRTGIYGPDGSRIVCHDVYVSNTGSALGLPTTSLPIRIMQKNTGTVISTSEMTFYEGAVLIEGQSTPYANYYEAGGVSVNVTNAAWVPLVSLRPQTDSKHTVLVPKGITVSAVLASDANIDGRVKVEVFKNATLTGATFATTKADSRYNVDTAATAMSGGKAVGEFFIKGTESRITDEIFSYLEEFLVQDIDGTKNTYTLAAKAIAADCSVIGAFNWNEYFVR